MAIIFNIILKSPANKLNFTLRIEKFPRKWSRKRELRFATVYIYLYIYIYILNKYLLCDLRLLDWEDRPEITRQKYEKVVVIKNIFSPNDFNVSLDILQ